MADQRELSHLGLWRIRRVDGDGGVVGETTTFDPEQARRAFDMDALMLGRGIGAAVAVYLLHDGRTVDQVVLRQLGFDAAEGLGAGGTVELEPGGPAGPVVRATLGPVEWVDGGLIDAS